MVSTWDLFGIGKGTYLLQEGKKLVGRPALGIPRVKVMSLPSLEKLK
jgi:hypothetical protein